jgi:hypothetical protein
MTQGVAANFAPHFAPSPPSCGWCVIPNPNVDGVVVGVSVNVWNAKRRFLERGHRGGVTRAMPV